MRLFGVVDGTIDRKDRAGWLSMPFDFGFQTPGVITPITIADVEWTLTNQLPHYKLPNNLMEYSIPRR